MKQSRRVRPWLTTRARIADGTAVAPTTRRSWWRPATAAAAALAIAFAGAATLTAGLADSSTDEQETVVIAP